MSEHDPESIVVPPGLEPVRRRPGMYVGNTDDGSGMHELLWTLVGVAAAEHLAGHATYVRVDLDGDTVSVEDDGRGIPVDPMPREPQRRALEVVMTTLPGYAHVIQHPQTHRWYGHGAMGPAPVSALSERLDVVTWQNGRAHAQSYARGLPLGPVRDVGPADRTGTRITFTPDFTLLARHPWNTRAIAQRLREIATLTPRLTTVLGDRAFRCPDGLADHVRYLMHGATPRHAQPIRVRGSHDEIDVDVALQWTTAPVGRLRGFVGGERVPMGTHIAGLRNGLLAAFRRLQPARFATVAAPALREVLAPGLVAAISVALQSPRFSDGRRRLVNPEVAAAVEAIVGEQLAAHLADDAELREHLLARMPAVAAATA